MTNWRILSPPCLITQLVRLASYDSIFKYINPWPRSAKVPHTSKNHKNPSPYKRINEKQTPQKSQNALSQTFGLLMAWAFGSRLSRKQIPYINQTANHTPEKNKNQKTSLPITAAKQGNKQTLLFWICKNINIIQDAWYQVSGTRYHIRFWKKKGMKNTEPYSFKGARLPVMKNSLLFIFVINLY